MKLTLCEPPTRITKPGATCHTLFDKCVVSLTCLLTCNTKIPETGPTVYSPYLRRVMCSFRMIIGKDMKEHRRYALLWLSPRESTASLTML